MSQQSNNNNSAGFPHEVRMTSNVYAISLSLSIVTIVLNYSAVCKVKTGINYQNYEKKFCRQNDEVFITYKR